MLRLAFEIAGRPVTFKEAGINAFSVLIELRAFFAHKCKQWILFGAVGRQLGICNSDGTVSWDVDEDGQRCAGSEYFKAELPRDEAVPLLRGVMDIVSDPKTTAMIAGHETCEQAWRTVVKDAYDLSDSEKGWRIFAAIDDQLASAAADALLLKRGAFLQSDRNGGLKPVVVAFAGRGTGDARKMQRNTRTFGDVQETAAEGGATFFGGKLRENAGKYDVVVFAADYYPGQLPTEVKE